MFGAPMNAASATITRMEYNITRSQDISRMCLVCGEENLFGLHATFYETEQGELIGIFDARPEHQSYPGRMHGGIAAAILDELIGRAVNMVEPDAWGVTIELTTKYRKPVPVAGPIVARARITKNTSRVFEGTGEIVLEDGTVAVQGTGRYIKMAVEKIADGTDYTDAMRNDSRELPESYRFPSKSNLAN